MLWLFFEYVSTSGELVQCLQCNDVSNLKLRTSKTWNRYTAYMLFPAPMVKMLFLDWIGIQERMFLSVVSQSTCELSGDKGAVIVQTGKKNWKLQYSCISMSPRIAQNLLLIAKEKCPPKQAKFLTVSLCFVFFLDISILRYFALSCKHFFALTRHENGMYHSSKSASFEVRIQSVVKPNRKWKTLQPLLHYFGLIWSVHHKYTLSTWYPRM